MVGSLVTDPRSRLGRGLEAIQCVADLAFQFGIGLRAAQRGREFFESGKRFAEGVSGFLATAGLLENVPAQREPRRRATAAHEHGVRPCEGVGEAVLLEEQFDGGQGEFGVRAERREAAVEPGERVVELAGLGEQVGGFQEMPGVRCGHQRDRLGEIRDGLRSASAQAQHARAVEQHEGIGRRRGGEPVEQRARFVESARAGEGAGAGELEAGQGRGEAACFLEVLQRRQPFAVLEQQFATLKKSVAFVGEFAISADSA